MFDPTSVAEMFTKLEANGYQDICTISRRTGGPSWDFDLNTQTDEVNALIYSGPCRVKSTASSSDEDVVGQEHAYTRRVSIIVPYSSTLKFHVGDFMVITQSGLDPEMAGIQFFITDVPRATWKVDIHLTGLEVQAPDGVV